MIEIKINSSDVWEEITLPIIKKIIPIFEQFEHFGDIVRTEGIKPFKDWDDEVMIKYQDEITHDFIKALLENIGITIESEV